MRKTIIISALAISTQAFGQGYYDAQSEAFFAEQRAYHNQQVQNSIAQQQMQEQLRQQRAIMNSYGQQYGYPRAW